MKPGLVNIHHTRLHWCWVIQHRPAKCFNKLREICGAGPAASSRLFWWRLCPRPFTSHSRPDLQWSKPQTAPASSPPAYLARSVRAGRGNRQPGAERRGGPRNTPPAFFSFFSSLVAAVALTDNHRTRYFSLRQIPILRPCGYK